MAEGAAVESVGPTPGRSRRIFIVTSVVLLILAGAYLVTGRIWLPPEKCGETGSSRPSACDWIPAGMPRASIYQVLYALLSVEIVLFLYLRGVEQWSPEAAVASVQKEQKGKVAARVAGGPVVSHPLGPRLEAPAPPASAVASTPAEAPPDARSAAF